ncbi:biotin--[acetyl-CoA-carboxylase] ligase [Oceanibacterium hippocampi]|uniref:biotin--[biotin carboxyl-carrier protein] ligase n=1 Tax=Oceanibacterium hippocampi TaxID=745714 RepID=A0A1Y5T0X0_9PROT|nr:biotin--[acetyl-CoA-carboxylase] ligase [Oceanibacterium hippocampi]SLN53666.1 Bifunctional ligase/repressor BirA [Oceanibacterium hippocampi]
MTAGPDAGLALPSFYDCRYVDEVESTQDEVRKAAEAGAPEGLIVRAGSQRAGVGRRARSWTSPPGNLYCSLLLRPAVAPLAAAQLSFAVALAIAGAVERHLPDSVRVSCKWPNDVLVDGRKIAGILLESRTGQGGLVDWLIPGTGINIDSHPDIAANVLPTSIRAAGGAGTPASLLAAYAEALLPLYRGFLADGFGPLREAWLKRADGLGQPLVARLPNTSIEGVFEDLDDAGGLVLGCPGGVRRVINAGEVFRPAIAEGEA